MPIENNTGVQASDSFENVAIKEFGMENIWQFKLKDMFTIDMTDLAKEESELAYHYAKFSRMYNRAKLDLINQEQYVKELFSMLYSQAFTVEGLAQNGKKPTVDDAKQYPLRQAIYKAAIKKQNELEYLKSQLGHYMAACEIKANMIKAVRNVKDY